MGSFIIGAGSEDRHSGCPGLFVTIGHPCVKGRLTLEVCVVNCANAFLVFLSFLVVDRPIQWTLGNIRAYEWPLALGNRW